MSGPKRWLHDDTSPHEVRELLQRAAGAGRSRPLPADSKARSAARLDRMLALPAAAGVLLWLKGTAIAAIAAGVTVVGVVTVTEMLKPSAGPSGSAPVVSATRTPGHAPPVRQLTPFAPELPSAPVGSPPPASDPTTSAAPIAPIAAPKATAVVGPHAPEPTASSEDDSIAREAAMLDRARGLLTSDPGAALAAVDALAAAFPSGHMGLERELLAVEALRRLQRVPEARARGEALLQRARGSIYEERVRTILGSLPPP